MADQQTPIAPATPAAAPAQADNTADDFFGSEGDEGGIDAFGSDTSGEISLGTASALDDGKEAKEAPPADDSAEVPDEDPAANAVSGDKTKYTFESADGTTKKMTIAEAQKAFKASVSFQADYTKKTTELASLRKQVQAKEMQLTSREKSFQENMGKVKHFFAEVSRQDADPYYAARLLRSQGVPVDRIVERLVEDVLIEREMPEEQRLARNRERARRAAEQEAQYHERRVQEARKKAQDEETRIRRTNDAKRAEVWLERSLKEAGLPTSEYEKSRVKAALSQIARKEQRPLMFEDFVEAARATKTSILEVHRKLPATEMLEGMTPEERRALAVELQKSLKGTAPEPKPSAAPAPGRGPNPPKAKQNGAAAKPTYAQRLKRGMI